MKEERGFALIYVVLLVALISITVVSVSVSSLNNIKIARKADETTYVRQVALSGLERGITEYKAGQTTTCPVATTNFFMVNGDPSYGTAIFCSDSSNTYIKSVGTYKNSTMSFQYAIINEQVSQF